MKTSTRASVIAASLVGSLAVQFVIACSNGHVAGTSSSSGTPDARADTPPCGQWEVQAFPAPGFTYQNVTYKNPDGSTNVIAMPTYSFQLPAGWEPIGAPDFAAVLGRRCVQ